MIKLEYDDDDEDDDQDEDDDEDEDDNLAGRRLPHPTHQSGYWLDHLSTFMKRNMQIDDYNDDDDDDDCYDDDDDDDDKSFYPTSIAFDCGNQNHGQLMVGENLID